MKLSTKLRIAAITLFIAAAATLSGGIAAPRKAMAAHAARCCVQTPAGVVCLPVSCHPTR
jgi:hypothetical protein